VILKPAAGFNTRLSSETNCPEVTMKLEPVEIYSDWEKVNPGKNVIKSITILLMYLHPLQATDEFV
jgi:hypothetical protein